MFILNAIAGPDDVRRLGLEQLDVLAGEIRGSSSMRSAGTVDTSARISVRSS
jgi:hypothetical protein